MNTNNTVISYRVKHNGGSYKYFIGYLHDDDVIRCMCVILSQMSGYIKYFENGVKNMPFKIEEESVYLKYAEIWNKIKSILNVKFHSQPIYDDKYTKTKVKKFSKTINILLSRDEIPKERIHYACISAICIDSVLRTDLSCKYKIKKRELVSFTDGEVNLSSDDSDDLDE